MMKAFFKGCWEILRIVLLVTGIITILLGNLYVGLVFHPLWFFGLIAIDAMFFWGSYKAVEYYQISKNIAKDNYLKEKVIIDEIYERGWISTEDHRVMISKLITKYRKGDENE